MLFNLNLSFQFIDALFCAALQQCAAVDPVEPTTVLAEVKRQGLTLSCVLTTHHHWDHAGGNSQLLKSLPSPIPVYGGGSNVEAVSKVVSHGDTVTLGDAITVTCLHTPCHTRDHICYYATEPEEPDGCVFTGDTLFLGGCGRFFEGNAQQM